MKRGFVFRGMQQRRQKVMGKKRKTRAGGTAGGARGDAGEGEHRAPVSYNYYSLGCFSRPGDNRGEGETHV